MQSVRVACERAIRGYQQPERSSFLAWTAELGPDLDPEFVADQQVLKHELWLRQRGKRAPATPRLEEVLKKWSWRRKATGRFETPFGEVDLDFDEWQVVLFHAKLGWKRALWKREPRAENQPIPPGMVAWVKAQEAILRRSGGRDHLLEKAALMAAPSGQSLVRMSKRTDKPVETVVCACGEALPSRDHLLWECPERGGGLPIPPVQKGCRRLLVPFTDGPRMATTTDCQPPAQLVRIMSQQWVRHGKPFLVATDGGAKGANHFERRAAWGLAVAGEVFSGPLASAS